MMEPYKANKDNHKPKIGPFNKKNCISRYIFLRLSLRYL